LEGFGPAQFFVEIIRGGDAFGDETTVPGLFVAESVVAGVYNNRVFIENGRLHGGMIAAAIRKK
jgi:thioredoxin reductase